MTAIVLLRTRRLVAPQLLAATGSTPPPIGKLPRRLGLVPADVPSGVAALEFELLQLGFLVSAELYAELERLSVDALTRAGRRLLHALRQELGANATHVPLFRKFPDSVPSDTLDFYVNRVFSLLLQEPERPCVLCGEVGVVQPVSPCAHLVCRSCWDGSDYSACPICHRRIDLDDPFLVPSDARITAEAGFDDTTTLLRLCVDPEADAREIAGALLARRTPLADADRDDLIRLVEDFWPASAAWLPDEIPVRETKASMLGVAVSRGVTELLPRHLGTATDVLRLMYVLMGADPGLRRRRPARHSLSRPIRRALLGCLDAMALPSLVEDLRRFGPRWRHMADALHPFEFHRRFPDAALAFAVLRGTPLSRETAFGRSLLERAALHPGLLELRGDRLRSSTFNARVEVALAGGDHAQAVDLLSSRPGELARRLSQLLRLGPAPYRALEPALRQATPYGGLEAALRRVAPGVLVAALGQVRARPGGMRLFLPRGATSRMWTTPDTRPPPAAEAVARVERAITAELTRRAAALPPLERVLIDEGLCDLVAPTSERGASEALVRLTRGSVQPIPGGDRLRFFLHWVEPPHERVDLDLSVGVYDDQWQFVGVCDYTNLRLGDAVVHSGDLTSAPAPLGASEFIDVDVRGLPGRYLVPCVFSYNDVPFEELVTGFAGFMEHPGERLFEPRAVRQRLELTGPAKVLVPLVADLRTRTLRWADLHLSDEEDSHSVFNQSSEMGRVGEAMETCFASRVTMWEVACWHAGARASEVLVRRADGTVVRHSRLPGEDAASFAARLASGASAPGAVPAEPLGAVDLAVLVHGDVPAVTGFALYPDGHQLGAADLLSGLAPEPARVAV